MLQGFTVCETEYTGRAAEEIAFLQYMGCTTPLDNASVKSERGSDVQNMAS